MALFKLILTNAFVLLNTINDVLPVAIITAWILKVTTLPKAQKFAFRLLSAFLKLG